MARGSAGGSPPGPKCPHSLPPRKQLFWHNDIYNPTPRHPLPLQWLGADGGSTGSLPPGLPPGPRFPRFPRPLGPAPGPGAPAAATLAPRLARESQQPAAADGTATEKGKIPRQRYKYIGSARRGAARADKGSLGGRAPRDPEVPAGCPQARGGCRSAGRSHSGVFTCPFAPTHEKPRWGALEAQGRSQRRRYPLSHRLRAGSAAVMS